MACVLITSELCTVLRKIAQTHIFLQSKAMQVSRGSWNHHKEHQVLESHHVRT